MSFLIDKFLGESANEPTTWRNALEAIDACGILDRGELTEQIIGETRNSAQADSRCQKAWDLKDGAEIKYATLRKSVKFHYCEATISGVSTKTGIMLIVVIDPINDKPWFFRIPNVAYTGRTGLILSFNCDRQPSGMWAKYVTSYAEMCAA